MDGIERIVAGRWIAGESVEDAIHVAGNLNKSNIRAIINYLGELQENKAEIRKAADEYLKLIKKITKSGVKADIAVKPTQIGLALGKLEFLMNFKRIKSEAGRAGVFVWLDMEEQEFVSDTIDVYLETMSGFTGICIQAYLKRSLRDASKLVARGAVIRLVKGAHRSKGPGFYGGREVTSNYMRLMDYLFRKSKVFTVASHDPKIIERALRLNRRYRRRVTYAMLEGIRSNYAIRLAQHGELVSTYVPFGPEWRAYSLRRLEELGNLKLVLRSLLGG